MNNARTPLQAFDDIASLPEVMACCSDCEIPFFQGDREGLIYSLYTEEFGNFTLEIDDGPEIIRKHHFDMPSYHDSPIYWRFPFAVSGDLYRCYANRIDLDTKKVKDDISHFLQETNILPGESLELSPNQMTALQFLQMDFDITGTCELTLTDPPSIFTDDDRVVKLPNLPAWIGLKPSACLLISARTHPGLRKLRVASIILPSKPKDPMIMLRVLNKLQQSGISDSEIYELQAYAKKN